MADKTDTLPVPTLEDIQHWTWIMGRAQQLMMEHVARQLSDPPEPPVPDASVSFAWSPMMIDPAKVAQAQVDLWSQGLDIWRRVLTGKHEHSEIEEKADKDKRFAAPEWRENPLFDLIRQSYILISDRLLGSVDALEGLDEKQRERLRFATRMFVDAMSPSNFALTNPQVIERTL